MCGLSAIFGGQDTGGAALVVDRVRRMNEAQVHRGPDDSGVWSSPSGDAVLGHDRLSILDLTDAAHQPAVSDDGRFVVVFNGEIYNYRELRAELTGHAFRSTGDTEVVVAAWEKWGEACLDRFLGFFSIVVWDAAAGVATLVRDRFGVKPLYLAERPGGELVVASEIKAIHTAGVPCRADLVTWATYLSTGRLELPDRTFWEGVRPLPAGCLARWSIRERRLETRRWYDLHAAVGEGEDERPDEVVAAEWLDLALDSVSLRFRSDVPVGINLSGGVDSSFLVAAVDAVQPNADSVTAFTFVTGDPNYDELPWVEELLAGSAHPSRVVDLSAVDVPRLAAEVAAVQDEPFGGIPTLAYARLFEVARSTGTIVLLDGQGLDEQWAGYDYYRLGADRPVPLVQGSQDSPVRPACLLPGSGDLVPPDPVVGGPRSVRSLQARDLLSTKIPRALRYNDRTSMRSSCELREPFLDHRLVELALRQPDRRKVSETSGKVFLRRILADFLPATVVEAPKRPLQTPQREWLRGPLADWASDRIDAGLSGFGGELLDPNSVRAEWSAFRSGRGDNSHFVWQWISLGLDERLVK